MNICSERYTTLAEVKRAKSCLPFLAPNACFLRKIARKFREYFIISEHNSRRKIYFRSQSAVLKEKCRHIKKHHWFIIHPFSLFTKYWQIFMIFIWLTVLTNDMFSVAFRPRLKHQGYSILIWYYIIFVCNTICCIDVAVNFLTGFVEKERKIVCLEPGKIALHYTKTWLPVDSVSLFALLRMIITHHRNTYTWKILSLLRYARLLRIKTVLINFRWITDALQLRYGVYIILCMFIVSLYILHFNTCIYILIPDTYSKLRPETNKYSWIKRIEDQFAIMNKSVTAFDLYFLSLKECLLKFNIGSVSDVTPYNFDEVILSLIFLIIGYIIKIAMFIILLYLFDNQYESSFKYIAGFNQLKSFLPVKEMDKSLKKSIYTYYKSRYNNHYSDESFSDLSTLLRVEVMMDIWKGQLERSKVFQNLPRSFVADVAHFLRPDIFMPNYTIYKIGDIAKEMYFLCTGSVAIYNKTGIETSHVCDGEIFGIGLLDSYLSIRKDTAIAVEYCEVLCLHKKYLAYLCNKSKEFNYIINNLAATMSKASLGSSHLSTPNSTKSSNPSSQPTLEETTNMWTSNFRTDQHAEEESLADVPPGFRSLFKGQGLGGRSRKFFGTNLHEQLQPKSFGVSEASSQPSLQPTTKTGILKLSPRVSIKTESLLGLQSNPPSSTRLSLFANTVTPQSSFQLGPPTPPDLFELSLQLSSKPGPSGLLLELKPSTQVSFEPEQSYLEPDSESDTHGSLPRSEPSLKPSIQPSTPPSSQPSLQPRTQPNKEPDTKPGSDERKKDD